MAKKKGGLPKREFTKHQLTRLQKQKRKQRIILIVGISVIAVVSGVIGSGWYINEYQPMREIVIRVNDTEFNMGYYVNILEVQSQAYEQIYGPDQAALYMQGMASDMERFIEQSELMRQAAAELGIVVSDSEVDEELKKQDPPLSRSYRDIVRNDMLRQRLLDESFEQEVPVFAEQREVMATFLESEYQAIVTRAKLIEGEDFGELAGELSLENLSQAQNGNLGWHPKGILSAGLGLSVPEDYAFSAEVGVLSQPLDDKIRTKSVGYWLVKVLGKDEDEQGELFNVQVMLLGSEKEAQNVMARLENGEDFAVLAEEVSQDSASKEDGGDLGWLGPEKIYEPIKDFVLNAETGTLDEPIKDEAVTTQGGYWLVEVLDKDDNKKISNDDRGFLKNKALSEWVSSLWDDPKNKVEGYLNSEKRAWAVEKAMGS
ncbi:MAG: peptidylprolyl isomerase [Chloroflexi bacterium]|nr:peptidylprolyl isomerase [Chloroflexota bacterium]